jgi:hypothetical protein
MSPKRRSIALLLAIWYTMVLSGSGLMHVHGLACGEHHASSSRPGDDSHPSPCSPSSDEQTCPVCHFLAQKLIPATSSIEVFSTELVERVVRVAPICLPSESPLPVQCRAPPAVV